MGYVLRACFIPVCEGKADLSEIGRYYEKEHGNNIQYDSNSLFAAVGADGESDFEPYDLSEDSDVFGEAIGIQVTTYGDDFFLYDHWINRECVRAITYSPSEGWVRVEGKEEKWEEESFFKAGSLEQDLLWVERDSEIQDKEKRIYQLRHLIHVRHLIQGYMYPVISGEGTLFDVIKHFKLTYPEI